MKVKSLVSIKGNKYGIVVSMNNEVTFEEIKNEIMDKIKDSAKFFENAKSAISFEGRKLSSDEQQQIIDVITENSNLNIVCIIDNEREEQFKEAVEQVKDIVTETVVSNVTGGQFYRGTLRSGQVLESDASIVILGDVNPGAKIISAGNVVVLGSLKGTVYAGLCGDYSSFVVALDMYPVQIRIADIIARCSDKPKKNAKLETKIAYVEEGNIYIEPLSKEVLNDIKL